MFSIRLVEIVLQAELLCLIVRFDVLSPNPFIFHQQAVEHCRDVVDVLFSCGVDVLGFALSKSVLEAEFFV